MTTVLAPGLARKVKKVGEEKPPPILDPPAIMLGLRK